ncbi:hypothetical protein JW835_07305 [bacterium]|nr:hypothetical protein [bacterium]
MGEGVVESKETRHRQGNRGYTGNRGDVNGETEQGRDGETEKERIKKQENNQETRQIIKDKENVWIGGVKIPNLKFQISNKFQ